METCFFNSCLLNETISFNKYKKSTTEKKLFKYYEISKDDDELLKILGIGTKPKKINLCIKHFDQYTNYKTFMRTINEERFKREEAEECK